MNTIIENIRNDNRNSFKQLFKDYYPILCIFANKYILDEEASKDIAQEVLLTYWAFSTQPHATVASTT